MNLVRLFFIAIFAFLTLSASTHAQENTFVGSERCRSCHVKAYSIWSTSAHAKAQSNLPENRRNELRCLFCHATDAQANLTNYTFQNVQCESCHGAGSRHIALAAKGVEKGTIVGGLDAANETKCRICHNDVRSPKLRPFKYDAALQKIRHW